MSEMYVLEATNASVGVESVSDSQPGAVVGEHHVVMPQRPRCFCHVPDAATAVGPVRVGVAVPLQGVAVSLHLGRDLGRGARLELLQREAEAG